MYFENLTSICYNICWLTSNLDLKLIKKLANCSLFYINLNNKQIKKVQVKKQQQQKMPIRIWEHNISRIVFGRNPRKGLRKGPLGQFLE